MHCSSTEKCLLFVLDVIQVVSTKIVEVLCLLLAGETRRKQLMNARASGVVLRAPSMTCSFDQCH